MISAVLARPSAGIGVVEVQKLEVFCDFCGARATLCGDRRGRGAKTHGFFAISAVPAQRSAGIGVAEVQKLEVFCDFCCSNWSSGVVSWFARLLPGRRVAGSIPPWSAGGNLHFKATCAEQLAQSNLRRPTCTDQFAQSALPRATCAEQLTQSNLHRATCTEQLAQSNLQGAQFAQSNLQGATCRDQLAGATCAEQLAQSNLHRPTCTDQFAQSTLPGAVSRLLHKCFVEGKRTHPAALGRPRLRCYAFGPTVV